MTKLKLTVAPLPSGEDDCSELELFEERKLPKSPKAPGPHRDDSLLGGMCVYLRFPDFRRLGIPWSGPYIRELEEAGKFPRRVHLGLNTICWVASEVRSWQEERNAMRDAAPIAAPKAPPAGQPSAEKKLPVAKKKPAAKLPARRKDRGGQKVAEASDALAAG
jgi:predicted DNA-binding transcriptional regulator AlpA